MNKNITVSIVGRPNVGKSSLFNRITNKKNAIVEDISGVTRDRLYDKVEYKDKIFNLIDTGGITLNNGDFNQEIKIQSEIAINESDIIIFIVDIRNSITAEDELVASILRKTNKKIIIAANKADNKNYAQQVYDFYSLGFEIIIPISTVHGTGIIDILEEIYPYLSTSEVDDDEIIKFSIIGKPNVGKSSLFNSIIGEKRSIVSDIEGTTRDAIDTTFHVDNKEYKIIDTAGIRRRGKIYEKVEKYSVLRSLKSIENSDIILWVVDAYDGIFEQDKRVLGYALEERKPIIVIVNKWDLIEKDTNSQKTFKKILTAKMPYIEDSHFIFTSALNKKGIQNIIPAINDIYEKYTKTFTTSQLNNVLNDAVMTNVPPSYKGKAIKFYYVTQLATKPPRFLFFVNNKEIIHFSYKRYLENYYKNAFKLSGIKLKFQFKNKDEKNDF